MTGCPQPLLGFLARVAFLAADLTEKRDRWEVFRDSMVLDTDIRIYARGRVTNHAASNLVPRVKQLGTWPHWVNASTGAYISSFKDSFTKIRSNLYEYSTMFQRSSN